MAKNAKTTNEESIETSTVETTQESTDAAESPAAEKKQKAKEKEVDDGLVPMKKGGETLRVHPSTVHAHKAAGWEH